MMRTMAMVFAFVLTAGFAQAQVAVNLSDVSGRPGETVTVPVVVSGGPASPINSFGFTVNTPAGITFTGVETASTLSEPWGASVSSNTTTGAVGGFGAALSSNGTLVNLTFTYDNSFAGSGTVILNGFQTAAAIQRHGNIVTASFKYCACGKQRFGIVINDQNTVSSHVSIIRLSFFISMFPIATCCYNGCCTYLVFI